LNNANDYEAVEGGGPLGCVVIGAGHQFQLLIYNAKVNLLLFIVLLYSNIYQLIINNI
jgi:hypothetical protein